MDDNIRCPNKLKEIRKKAKLSQESLADLLEITRPYLSEIESGKKSPGGAIVIKAAKIFNMPAEEIFFTDSVHHGER